MHFWHWKHSGKWIWNIYICKILLFILKTLKSEAKKTQKNKPSCVFSRRCKTSRRSCDSLPCALSGRTESGAAPSSPPCLQHPPASPSPQPSPRKQASTRWREPGPKKKKKKKRTTLVKQRLLRLETLKWSSHLLVDGVCWLMFCWGAFARRAAHLHHHHHEGKGSHEKQLHQRTHHLHLWSQGLWPPIWAPSS